MRPAFALAAAAALVYTFSASSGAGRAAAATASEASSWAPRLSDLPAARSAAAVGNRALVELIQTPTARFAAALDRPAPSLPPRVGFQAANTAASESAASSSRAQGMGIVSPTNRGIVSPTNRAARAGMRGLGAASSSAAAAAARFRKPIAEAYALNVAQVDMLPTGPVVSFGGGYLQRFADSDGNATAIGYKAGWKVAFTVEGRFYEAWKALAFGAGALGHPTSQASDLSDSLAVQAFERGVVFVHTSASWSAWNDDGDLLLQDPRAQTKITTPRLEIPDGIADFDVDRGRAAADLLDEVSGAPAAGRAVMAPPQALWVTAAGVTPINSAAPSPPLPAPEGETATEQVLRSAGGALQAGGAAQEDRYLSADALARATAQLQGSGLGALGESAVDRVTREMIRLQKLKSSGALFSRSSGGSSSARRSRRGRRAVGAAKGAAATGKRRESSALAEGDKAMQRGIVGAAKCAGGFVAGAQASGLVLGYAAVGAMAVGAVPVAVGIAAASPFIIAGAAVGGCVIAAWDEITDAFGAAVGFFTGLFSGVGRLGDAEGMLEAERRGMNAALLEANAPNPALYTQAASVFAW